MASVVLAQETSPVEESCIDEGGDEFMVDDVDFTVFSGEGSEEGSTFYDVGSDQFVFSTTDWDLIQVYIHSALALPTTETAMRSEFAMDGLAFTSNYQSLMDDYSDMRASATQWQNEIYPDIVNLSLQLANYADIHAVFIRPLIQSINDADLIAQEVMLLPPGADEYNARLAAFDQQLSSAKIYLAVLDFFSTRQAVEVANVQGEINVFSTSVARHQQRMVVQEEAFAGLANDAQIAQFMVDIAQLAQRRARLNKEIAKKKRQVAWTAAGGPFTLLVGGSIAGAQLRRLKEDLADVNAEIEQLGVQFKHAVKVQMSLALTNSSISNIKDQVDAAKVVIDTLKGKWQEMRETFSAMLEKLELAKGEFGLCAINSLVAPRLALIPISSVQENWRRISAQARAFAQNAYLPED